MMLLLPAVLAASAVPTTAHTYTWLSGSLTGPDVIPPLNLTLAAAKAKCSSLTACVGMTFKAATQAPAGVVHAYFKNAPTGGPWHRASPWQTYLRDDFPQYPGPAWVHPKIHQSPFCLHFPGWHLQWLRDRGRQGRALRRLPAVRLDQRHHGAQPRCAHVGRADGDPLRHKRRPDDLGLA